MSAPSVSLHEAQLGCTARLEQCGDRGIVEAQGPAQSPALTCSPELFPFVQWRIIRGCACRVSTAGLKITQAAPNHRSSLHHHLCRSNKLKKKKKTLCRCHGFRPADETSRGRQRCIYLPPRPEELFHFSERGVQVHTHTRRRAGVIIEVFRGEALSHIKASSRQECQPNILNAVSAEEGNLS